MRERAARPHEHEFFAACKKHDIDEESGAQLYAEWLGLNEVGYRIPLRQFVDNRTGNKRTRFKMVTDVAFGVRRLVRR